MSRRLTVIRTAIVGVLALSVAACTLGLRLDVFINNAGKLVISTQRSGIIFKTRKRECVSALGVYDEDGYVWRLDAVGECFKLPVMYGEAPADSITLVAPKPLTIGKRYGVAAAASAAQGAIEFVFANTIEQKRDATYGGQLHEPAGVAFRWADKKRCEAKERRPCACARQGCDYGYEPAL